jgi:hypothetical protein
MRKLSSERQVLFDAISVGLVHDSRGAERTPALRAFASEQVALAGARAQDFACSCDFKPFGHRLFRLNSFWASHKTSLKNEREI